MTLSVKLTLLSIIIQVFQPYRKLVSSAYVVMVLLVAYYMAALIALVRVCSPVSAFWKGRTEICLDQSTIITIDAVVGVVSDIFILVLPLPTIWSLQMPRNKRLRIVAFWGVGGLATAFSIWRLRLILVHGKSPDQTVTFVKIVLSRLEFLSGRQFSRYPLIYAVATLKMAWA